MQNMALMQKFGIDPTKMRTMMGMFSGRIPQEFINSKMPQTQAHMFGQNGAGQAPTAPMFGQNGGGRQQQPFNPTGWGGNSINGGSGNLMKSSSPMLGGARQDSNRLDLPFQSQNGFGSMASGIGQIGQGVAGMFMDNPSDSAMEYINNANSGNQYLKPYQRAGAGILDPWQEQLMQIMQDPSAMMRMFGEGYQQSPGYQFQADEMTKRMNQSAAAGGYVGSPAAQSQLAEQINGLASQDYYKYMDNILGLYGQGLQGAQGMAGMGMNAASQMSQNDYNRAMAQAQAEYARQANQNQMIGGGIGNIIGGGLSILGY